MATGASEEQRPKKPAEWQRLAAEFLGTFLLTFVAAGADVLEFITNGTIGHGARYVAPALLVMAMIYSLSAISGAHLNPAVTLGFILRNCFPIFRIPGYLAAQVLGAAAAAFLLRAFFGAAIEHGITKPGLGFSSMQAMGIEALLSFILVYTILATSQEEAVVGKNAGLAVAGVIALSGLAFSPVSGASMNPARSIGPMIAAGQFQYLWVYIAGPLLGAMAAAGVAWSLHGPPNKGEHDAAHGKHSPQETR